MPLLDRKGLKADSWVRAGAEGLGNARAVILSWDAVPAAILNDPVGRQLGVDLPNTASLAALTPHLPRLALINIAFPGFGDGRGFSLARRIRRAGFTGTLRAVGPLIPDQFAYALACGFDEIELPDAQAARQPVAQWLTAVAAMSAGYQRGYAGGASILEQRRAARLADSGLADSSLADSRLAGAAHV